MSIKTGQAAYGGEDGPEKRQDAFAEGEWWPTSDPARIARGNVSAFADGAIWLECDTDAWEHVSMSETTPVDVHILHGRTASGAPLSLHGVHSVGGERDLFTQRADVRFIADRLIVGAAVSDESEVWLQHVRVSYRGLREWLMSATTQDIRTPLRRVEPAPEAEQAGARAEEWVRMLTITVEDIEISAYVCRGAGRSTRFRSVYDTRAWLQLRATEPISLAWWRREWIEPLRDLVGFGTREQTVVLALSGDTASRDPTKTVTVFMAPEVVVQAPQHHQYYQRDLLPAGIWGEDGFDALIANWQRLHVELGAVGQAFFELANAFDVPPLTRLLRLTSCAEGYHRALHDEPPFSNERHDRMVHLMIDALPEDRYIRCHYRNRLRYANSQSQRQRIRWLIERAAEVDDRIGGRGRELTNRLVGWRNEHTHLDVSALAPPLDDLLLLNAVLSYVMAANILLDIGIGDDTRYCLAKGHVWDDPIAALDLPE